MEWKEACRLRLLNILGFILTVAVGFIVIIATLTFIIAWSAIG